MDQNLPLPLPQHERDYEVPVTLSNSLCEEGVSFMLEYDINTAISRFTKSLHVNPYSPLSLAYRSDAYVLLGDISSAVEDVRSAIYVCNILIENYTDQLSSAQLITKRQHHKQAQLLQTITSTLHKQTDGLIDLLTSSNTPPYPNSNEVMSKQKLLSSMMLNPKQLQSLVQN